MMRWRDGRRWSPSRINGPFLMYREVEAGSPTGARKDIAGTRERFDTTCFRAGTRGVVGGLVKRTVTLEGSDGNRYRVINYFYPGMVEGWYLADGGGGVWGRELMVPSFDEGLKKELRDRGISVGEERRRESGVVGGGGFSEAVDFQGSHGKSEESIYHGNCICGGMVAKKTWELERGEGIRWDKGVRLAPLWNR
ncbi:hypothetical protein BCR33DRAFT_232432 [Rhizoclosmatium globosum]|uniref:Uncharacterized protein n=1 Tax=Rhizoclosmatium globosum TaxID=329046 RepID=A0A1Y2CAB9_9FUNG|nr:hypothetical protein BCR33DRAFT_232432 [Rhizoclosmatium globosum]|eukprot:ORY43970.1 hypothetical protein BCR33DRAFT_232432 [Rhizoclosmatium globosum]